MKYWVIVVATGAMPVIAAGDVVCNQQPVSGGGVSRTSQLWIDPGPNGNDLDGDSVCWSDFTLNTATSINHLEWWGIGACELGFRIEFWRQDPGTIAYQPIGVFYYGGNHSIHPESRIETTAYTTTPGPGGINHYSLNLSTPTTLAANDPSNVRWFVAIVGLTHQAFATWNFAQGLGPGHTFQFIRGGYSGGGPLFRSLGEARAVVIEGTPMTPPCYPNCDASTQVPILNIADFGCFLQKFAAGDPYANCDNSTQVPMLNVADFGCFLQRFTAGCP